jgi:hypothetical protein
MTISNTDDIIDSRDVIKRIEELESDRQALVDALEGVQTEEDKLALEEWDNGDEAEELKALKALAEEASGSGDWGYGESLIRDSYFEQYAQELARDIGAIAVDVEWPLMHIDWEAAAAALKQDYTSVDFDGVEYWIRS